MEPFLGEIRLFAGNFAPRGWAFCEGQLLPISLNSQLFQILGTVYGGDGKTTFALPDFRGRAPMHHGQGVGLSNRTIGEKGGQSNVTLTESQLPSHTHIVYCDDKYAENGHPEHTIWTSTGHHRAPSAYSTSANTNMKIGSIGVTGDSKPHNNMQPYLGLNYIIALEGIFPSRP